MIFRKSKRASQKAQLNAAKVRIERLEKGMRMVLEEKVLQHMAGGKCQCDPEVGMTPCETCAASNCVHIITSALNGAVL